MIISAKECEKFYQENGFALHHNPVIPLELIKKALKRIPHIISGDYNMGFPPSRRWNVGDSKKVQKIDQIHRCDSAFFDIVTFPGLAETVAKIVGAKKLQVWDSQLFIKPKKGGNNGNIGWHTDDVNWHYWDGEVFTVWLPLVNVNKNIGTISYLSKSHKLTYTSKVDDAYKQDMTQLESKFSANIKLDYHYVELPAGAFSIHHKKLIHGSRENKSEKDRICLAINLRTENSFPLYQNDEVGFLKHIDNPVFSPIVYLLGKIY